jgi:hypothetical protein
MSPTQPSHPGDRRHPIRPREELTPLRTAVELASDKRRPLKQKSPHSPTWVLDDQDHTPGRLEVAPAAPRGPAAASRGRLLLAHKHRRRHGPGPECDSWPWTPEPISRSWTSAGTPTRSSISSPTPRPRRGSVSAPCRPTTTWSSRCRGLSVATGTTYVDAEGLDSTPVASESRRCEVAPSCSA